MALLPVIPGVLPSGFCPDTYQSLLNEFSSHQSVDVTAGTGVGLVVSATKPTDGTLPWLRLDQFGRPEHLYWFAAGAWLSLHPLVPGLTQWWFDTVPDFTTFDGGDANAASVLSGPMWQLAKRPNGTVIAAQFPVAVGTLASGAALAVGDVGGEEKHLLTIAELPAHTHTIGANNALDINAGSRTVAGNGTDFPDSFNSGSVGGDTAHNNLPPYVVGYLLQRTGRLFYAVT